MNTKKLIEAGTHTVKVKSHYADLNKNGKPRVCVLFTNGAWYEGYFVGGALEYTVKNLVAAGFKGQNPNDLNNPGALDKEKNLEIVVEHETGQDNVVRAKVQWINEPDRQKNIDAGAVTVLKGIDLRGHMIEAGVKKPTSQQGQAQQQGQTLKDNFQDQNFKVETNIDYTSESIPF